MKLKRFLSLFVATIMVLAVVPAMSVSAAGTTDTITALGAEVVWTCPDGSFNDTAVSTAWPGWNATVGAGTDANIKTYGVGNTLQIYKTDANNNDISATITSPGYGAGADLVVLEWVHKTQIAPQGGGDLYFSYSYKDINGVEIFSANMDKNDITVDDASPFGYPAEGTKMAFAAYNNEDGTHTVDCYVAGSKVHTLVKDGTINGFGSIAVGWGPWSSDWNHMGFANLAIGAVVPETMVTVEAQYTVNGEVVHTETGSYDTAKGETEATFPAYTYSANGSNVMYATDGATLSESGTIEMTAATNAGTHAVGDIFAKDGVQYEIKSANLVPNGDFSYGLDGWYGANNGALNTSNFRVNDNGTVTSLGSKGTSDAGSLMRAWAIEEGKTYVFVQDNDGVNEYHKFSLTNTINAEDSVILGGAASAQGNNATGTTHTVFTNNDGYAYAQIKYRWTTSTFGNFGLYEIAEAEVAVQETVATVADIAPVKVIGDTAVVLPSTVKVTGSLGTVVDAPIVWDAPESYNVGEATVEGTATVQFGEQEATTVEVSTTVTVLEETFTLPNVTTVNGQTAADEALVKFPVAISDEFSIEFTANYASFGDLWITLKDSARAKYFGPEQLPLGVNASGAFRPVNGNGTGGRTTADSDKAHLTTGVNYRFFITTDASTDKYTVSIFDEATGAEVVTVEDFGYRTNADYIDSIVSLTNNGAGSVTLTDIKVNANVEKTEYTVNITLGGVTTTATQSYWSDADALASIEDIEGYEKTVTIEGTTITVVYSATQTLSATFIDASENVIKEVSEVVAIGETYTVVAEEIFFLDGNYNGYFYQIPEIVLSADNNNLVITVSETANKYAVKEDALITGGTEIWGVKAENNNSVFVASAGSASAPTVDANGEKNHNPSHTPSTLGTSRLGFFLFPVVDVADGQKVTANFYVREWHGNGFSNGNDKLRLTAHAVTDHTWATLADGDKSYSGPDATLLETWATPVFSEWCYNNVGYIAFDITEMMVAAKEAGMTELTLRLNAPYGAAYIAEREKATVGKAYAGKAAYIAVEDAGLVKVTETGYATLTKNGSEMNGFAYVAATDDVRLVADGAVVIGTDAGYYMANENLNLTEAAAFENTVPTGLGLAMVGGAQVRIGSTELEADAKLDALADSGLRFLATADYADTVLADAEEFGIKVQAEASDVVAYVKAEKFQNDDNNVFSAAITNMEESNYNRKYTACAYAKVAMADGAVEEFTTDSVTRSIYQVSAGIMKNGTADADDAPYTVDGVVKNILNAYVNQTGIRLTYTADGITVEEGKYTGDVFFTVESIVNADGSVAVTITPDASWGTPAEIASWWTDYVRVNNNNSVAKKYISDAAVDEAGVLTFTFTVPAE